MMKNDFSSCDCCQCEPDKCDCKCDCKCHSIYTPSDNGLFTCGGNGEIQPSS